MFRTNPGTRKLGVFWERTYAKITQNCSKPPNIAENRLAQILEQLGCVPASEHYPSSALVSVYPYTVAASSSLP